MTTNRTVTARFTPQATTNYGTPYAWLAGYGFTTDFENAALQIGSNAQPYWASYIAGLNPLDPLSQFTLASQPPRGAQTNWVFAWNPAISGRWYMVLCSTNGLTNFTAMRLIDFRWPRAAYTVDVSTLPANTFFRARVRMAQ